MQLSKSVISTFVDIEWLDRWTRLSGPDFGEWERIHYDKPNDLGSPTYYAAVLGLQDVLAGILSISQADVNARGKIRGNALYAASLRGHEKVVQMLLDRGADIEAQRSEYDTDNALCGASAYGREKVVEVLLISRGAEINAPGRDEVKAIYMASLNGHANVVQILLDNGADANAPATFLRDSDPLYTASERGFTKIVRMLLEKGANINLEKGSPHGSALAIASENGREEVVKILLENSVDANQPGWYLMRSPLWCASMGGRDKIVHLLFEKGAIIGNGEGSRSGGNALHVASYHGYVKILRLLIDYGADVDATCRGGRYGTAMQIALNKGREEVVQIL